MGRDIPMWTTEICALDRITLARTADVAFRTFTTAQPRGRISRADVIESAAFLALHDT